MIISHSHSFIFLHCRKVAGSSVTAYLNKFLGPNDLQVGGWTDSLKFGGRRNRRFYMDLMSSEGTKNLLSRIAGRMLTGKRIDLTRCINNAHYQLYYGKLGIKPVQPCAQNVREYAPNEWDSYFKFCFVRNPYARAVSDYKWRTKRCHWVSFTEWLLRVYDPSRSDPEGVVPTPRTNWPIYTIDDKIVVDFVGKFENLSDDLRKICDEILVPFSEKEFPHAKDSGASNRKDYRDFYKRGDKQLVESIYGDEIDKFNYTF